MCNRIAIPSTEKLKAKYPHLKVQDIQPSYHSNGYDHEMVPIITNEQPNEIQPARWGFLPEKARTPEDLGGYDTLNARCETIFQSTLYQEAARSKRCVLLVSGFFEFKHYRGKKYPHFIAKEDAEIFSFGGLWNPWKDLLTCTIITTPANNLLADIHNIKRRMPFIIPENEWEQWLDISQEEGAIQDMMMPYPVEDLVTWQVGSQLTQKGADKNTQEVQQPMGPEFSKAPFPTPEPLPATISSAKEKPSKSKKPPVPPSPQLDLF